jgi:hypothetical protein
VANVVHNPTIIQNCQVSIDGNTYGDAIDSAIARPSFVTHKWKGVSGKAVTKVGALDWDLVLNLGQDYTDGSLLQVLIDRHGEEADIVLTPVGQGAGQPTITGKVTLVAVTDVGGKVDEMAVTGSTMGFVGKPTIVWGAAPAA